MTNENTGSRVGCPSKLVSIRNNRNWNRNLFGHHPKRLFRLFRFYTETESFDVSIEPKQTKDQRKQFDRKHNLLFFTENLGFFRFFRFFSVFCSVSSVCFETVCFGVSVVSLLYRKKSLKESIFGYFSENLGLFRLKLFVFGFTKQTETNAKQILFRFV